ncbi:MAG: glycine/sarcosine/betaine reductase selenoprotein B family protein [Syntrophaceae bacterium]
MMGSMTRLKNRLIARVITRVPSLAKGFIEAYKPWENRDVPWAPVRKPLADSVVALVTTAGVHPKDQKAFDMHDKNGDHTYREIDAKVPVQDLMITHDYYDHADADKDIDIVFPLSRIREFAAEGLIGGIARTHYGFMGHITGPHIFSLMHESAPKVAARLHRDKVDCVLLTPG